jgi:transposase
VVVEFTYNWYWLVDGLQEQGYRMHLANPSAIRQYEGLKHTDDKWDAFWLAQLLLLGILPQGYIYGCPLYFPVRWK